MGRARPALRMVATTLTAASLILTATPEIGAASVAHAGITAGQPTIVEPALAQPTMAPPAIAPPTLVHERARPAADPPSATAVIVKFRSGVDAAARADSRSRAGARRVRSLRSIGAEVVRPRSGRTVAGVLAKLAADPAVEYAEPDSPVIALGDPAAEPFLGPYQWGLENPGGACAADVPCRADVDVDALAAWPLATGNGVTVAVLDDGIDLGNPELAPQAWVNPGETGPDGSGGDRATNGVDDDGNGYVDDVNGVNLCSDATPQTLHVDGVDWHGTAVASVLAAAADGSGMVGMAPDARVMAVRWLEPACSTVSYAVDAIEYAIAGGARVINASWGTLDESEALRDAVEDADAAGVLIVAAAGNEGSTQVLYPAAFDEPNVISVAAVAADGSLAWFSSYGPAVDLAAPGEAILAIDLQASGGYAFVNGTSFAAPFVAGIAALVGELRPDLLANPAAMRSRIIGSGWADPPLARPVTASGRVADARNALDMTPPTPPASITGGAKLGSRIGSTAVTVRLTWPAATDDLAVSAYRVRYRRSGTSAWSTGTGWVTRRAATLRLAAGAAYQVEITTRDAGANTVSVVYPFRIIRRQEGYATYHGHWVRTRWSSASGGHTRYATRAGSKARFTITGRSVALVMPTAPANGAVRVYVDGAYAGTLHLHAARTHPRRVVFRRDWAASGTHAIRLVVVGGGAHPRVDLDAILIGR
jgi:subtilisin family serine protease